MKTHRLIGVLLVVLACLAIAGAALATGGSGPKQQSPRPARVHAGVQSSEQSSESENTAESEAGQQGEPAQGHEDPPGQDVNHECTGNCQE